MEESAPEGSRAARILALCVIFAVTLAIVYTAYIIEVSRSVEQDHCTYILVGSLASVGYNPHNDSMLFELTLACPEGVPDENLHSASADKKYTLVAVTPGSETVVNPNHTYVDVQNDYIINTGDLIVLHNASAYIGGKLVFSLRGYQGAVEADIAY
jgi:hypothetical protein